MWARAVFTSHLRSSAGLNHEAQRPIRTEPLDDELVNTHLVGVSAVWCTTTHLLLPVLEPLAVHDPSPRCHHLQLLKQPRDVGDEAGVHARW